MIDEKKCYFFGRNKELCDFTSKISNFLNENIIFYNELVDHASCSRVHSALLWHKDLNRPFLIDLGSSKKYFY
jgi:nuclear inhibitor of protein phosphatase 1